MKELKSQIVALADIPNKNKRIYTKQVLQKIVEYFNSLPKRTMLGQMGMPDSSVIRLVDISHAIDNLYLSDKNELIADICIMDTPRGKDLSELVNKTKIVFRLQGVGDGIVDENGCLVVGDSYKIVTINAILAEDAA